MIGKLVNVVGIVATATLLASGGFVGYLFGTGRLSHSRLETMAAVLRGERDAPPEAPKDEITAPDTQPAPDRTAEDLRALRQHEHLESLRIERAMADLEAQRRLLDQAMQTVMQEQERLAKEKAAVAIQKNEKAAVNLDAGFKKELEYVSGLPPRQAKEHIVRVWKKQSADAVRLFMELDSSRGKRILEQFKTPEELEILTDLLEQIRTQGSAKYNVAPAESGHATPSGTTAGEAAP